MYGHFLEKIGEYWDDDKPRLAFADWLESKGESARAAWIRHSCALSEATPEQYTSVHALLTSAFEECRPHYWSEITNVGQQNDRGVYRFKLGESRTARAKAAYKRLAKTRWLAEAHAEAWLDRIEVWCDSPLAELVSQGGGLSAEVPLFVRTAAQIDAEALASVFALPSLIGVSLQTASCRLDIAGKLASFPHLRELELQLRLVDDDWSAMLLGEARKLPALRRLQITGHHLTDRGAHPNDADVAALASIKTLRRLELGDCSNVSAEGVAAIRKARPDLSIVRW